MRNMVVCNDNVHAHAGSPCHFLHSGHSRVHGDYEADSLVSHVLDGRNGQAVPLIDSVGQVGQDRYSQFTQTLAQNGSTGYAINVKVSKYPYFFSLGQGLMEAGDGPVHPRNPLGVVG